MRGEKFKFKQFEVDQAGCAMKINTDGVLLGAFATAVNPKSILDIGTGTGVIALMMAQKFCKADITALDIDSSAAVTAQRNFEISPFGHRLKAEAVGFATYFETNPDEKFDLIVSNPPFYVNSLTSPKRSLNLAKHADTLFFEQLINGVSKHLTDSGTCWLILPVSLAVIVTDIARACKLYLQRVIPISSFRGDEAHRHIIVLGRNEAEISTDNIVIYDAPKQYSQRYVELLKDFFIVF